MFLFIFYSSLKHISSHLKSKCSSRTWQTSCPLLSLCKKNQMWTRTSFLCICEPDSSVLTLGPSGPFCPGGPMSPGKPCDNKSWKCHQTAACLLDWIWYKTRQELSHLWARRAGYAIRALFTRFTLKNVTNRVFLVKSHRAVALWKTQNQDETP